MWAQGLPWHMCGKSVLFYLSSRDGTQVDYHTCLVTTFSQYAGLNENGPHRLIYLNAWSPVGGIVRKGLEGVPVGVCFDI